MKWKFWQREKSCAPDPAFPATEQAQIAELYKMSPPDVQIQINFNGPAPSPEVVAGLLRALAVRLEQQARWEQAQ